MCWHIGSVTFNNIGYLSEVGTGRSLNVVFFSLTFLNSANSAAVLVFDLPSGDPSVKSSVHTLTPRENREGPEYGIYWKIFEKHNI